LEATPKLKMLDAFSAFWKVISMAPDRGAAGPADHLGDQQVADPGHHDAELLLAVRVELDVAGLGDGDVVGVVADA